MKKEISFSPFRPVEGRAVEEKKGALCTREGLNKFRFIWLLFHVFGEKVLLSWEKLGRLIYSVRH